MALVDGAPRPVVLYVISPAGKPVWCSDGAVSEDALSPTCGVLTAVVALAEDAGRRCRCIWCRRPTRVARDHLALVHVCNACAAAHPCVYMPSLHLTGRMLASMTQSSTRLVPRTASTSSRFSSSA